MLLPGSTGKITAAIFLMGSLLLAGSRSALAATVRGVVMNRDGGPVADDQVHLENQVTGNLYLTETGKDGSFSVEVPPGWYDLRERGGAIIKSDIRVDVDPLNLGNLVRQPRASFWRFFQRERLAPILVDSPAPATVGAAKGPRIPKVVKTGSTVPNKQATPLPSGQSAQTHVSNAGSSGDMSSSAASGSAEEKSADTIPPRIRPDYEPVQSSLAAPGVQ
jgi:hypothetical protein